IPWTFVAWLPPVTFRRLVARSCLLHRISAPASWRPRLLLTPEMVRCSIRSSLLILTPDSTAEAEAAVEAADMVEEQVEGREAEQEVVTVVEPVVGRPAAPPAEELVAAQPA